MKHRLLIMLAICGLELSAQETEYPPLFKTDSTWFKEVIPFPIHFAPEIEYEGYEDLRFMPGWAKKDSPEFWSYLFAWNINTTEEPSKEQLEQNLEYYFNGIMELVNKEKDFKVPDSNAVLSEVQLPNSSFDFRGSIYLHDSFHTREMMTLNVLVSYQRCTLNQKSIIVFRLSQEDFESEVWKRLNAVKVISGECK